MHKDCIYSKKICDEDPYLSQMTIHALMLTNVLKMTTMIATFSLHVQMKLVLIPANVSTVLMAMVSTVPKLMSARPVITTVTPMQLAPISLVASIVHAMKVIMAMAGNVLMGTNVLMAIVPEISTELMTLIMIQLTVMKTLDAQTRQVVSIVLATKATMVTVLFVKIRTNVAKLTAPVKSTASMKRFLQLMNVMRLQPVSIKQVITTVLVMTVTLATDSTARTSMSVTATMNVTKMPFVTISSAVTTVHVYKATSEVALSVVMSMSVIPVTTTVTSMRFVTI